MRPLRKPATQVRVNVASHPYVGFAQNAEGAHEVRVPNAHLYTLTACGFFVQSRIKRLNSATGTVFTKQKKGRLV